MKFRLSFTLYPRKNPSGRVVWYYQTYDERGRRLCGRSTGQTTKTAAREYCHRLIREGRLLPEKKRMPTFEEYCVGWWDYETCEYLKWRTGRKKMSKNYAESSKRVMNNHLLPTFGKYKLNEITRKMVDDWMMAYRFKEIGRKVYDPDKDEYVSKKYDNATINVMSRVLSVMLGEAVRREILTFNPCSKLEELIVEEKEIEILTPDEVKKFFGKEWYSDLDGRVCLFANKLAACTGMRISEVLGLRGEYLFDTFVKVKAQYNNHGYVDVKTHKARDIPIPTVMRQELEALKLLNGNGFLFSATGGDRPIAHFKVRQVFQEVLEFVGISNVERVRRGLSFHKWRHFFNTILVMANITDRKVQAVTGHSSKKMTKRYTHLNATQFPEVRAVQNVLFLEAETAQNGVFKDGKQQVISCQTPFDGVLDDDDDDDDA